MKRNPQEQNGAHRTFSRRALLLGGAQLAFAGGLAMRMRYLQVEQADQFRLLAEENRIKFQLIPPARGEIFDRNGIILARNTPSYRINIVPEDAGDVEKVIHDLGLLIDLDPDDLEREVASEFREHRDYH